jgi:spermidine/putrescine-binding protein
LSEQSGANDIALNYANTKENYEKQIQKLKDRLVKQKKQHGEITQLHQTLSAEVE